MKPQITPFNASANADIYNNVEGIIFQKIVSAHRLSSPTLAGVSGGGNLSGNAAEIIDAYVLYNYTVIAQLRRNILDHLNRFTKINRTSPLVIDDLDVVDKMQEQGGETSQEEKSSGEVSTEPSPAEEPVKMSATLRKRSTLRKLLQQLHKYIRRIPKPGGGYRYIYKESGAGGASKQPAEKVPEKRSKASASEKTGPVPVKSPAARLRAKYLGEMRPLLKKKVTQTIEGGKKIRIGFTPNGNRHLYSDTFKRTGGKLPKSELKNLDKALEQSVYIKSAPLSKERTDNIKKFYYFRDNRKELYYNVAETRNEKHVSRFLYSITTKIHTV